MLLRNARKSRTTCAVSPETWAVAADRPRAMENKAASSACGGAARKQLPSANRGAAVIRAHRAQLRRAEDGTGMVASAPRVDMGPGLPATACRKCRTATSHDELSRSLCFVSPWVVLDAAFSSGGCVHFRFSVYTCRSNRVCAHAEARPALTQVVSKKAKAALSIARQRFPRLSRGRQLRNGEDAANLHTLFPLRLATNCADHALHDLPQQSDC